MDDLLKTADAVIIGGGVMGTSIAYHLTRRGMRRVVVLEQHHLGSGSSGKSSAIIRTHYSTDITARMALQSLHAFVHFSDLIGGNAGFVQTGMVIVAAANDGELLRQKVDFLSGLGINNRLLSIEELRQLHPYLQTDDLVAAAYEPESGYADPAGTIFAFAAAARAGGAVITQGTAVTGIQVAGGTVQGVRTTRGDISSPVAICAAGPWAKRVAAMVGLDLPLTPTRHQILTVRRHTELGVGHPVYADLVHATYFRPEGNHLTLVGSLQDVEEPEEAVPDSYSEKVDFAFREDYARRLCRRIPVMQESFFQGGWAGLYTETPDAHPILDRFADPEGFYVAVGFSGHGFKLSPTVGAMMAEFVTTGGCETFDITRFRAGRFAEGELIGTNFGFNVLA
ncbi:Dimethylglycine oxidase [Candidatus Entotheonellaceae bacterium PAL068K]